VTCRGGKNHTTHLCDTHDCSDVVLAEDTFYRHGIRLGVVERLFYVALYG
jgi:hypothetical protein